MAFSSHFHLPKTANSHLYSFSRYLHLKLGCHHFLVVSTIIRYQCSTPLVFYFKWPSLMKRKVAITSNLNNFWCFDQRPTMLYIFRILDVLEVQRCLFFYKIFQIHGKLRLNAQRGWKGKLRNYRKLDNFGKNIIQKR